MAKYSTYDQVGLAEDVADKISNLSPTKTPYQTAIGTADKATARMYEWQEDDLAAVQDNATVEGADAGTGSQSPTTMRSNYTQILDKIVQVTGTANAVKTYGRQREVAYQLAKKGKELKRDFEYELIGKSKNAALGDASSNPRKFGNIFGQDANGNDMVDPSVVVTTDTGSGSPGPLTEDNLLTLGEKLFNEGSEPSVLMIPPRESTNVAEFAAASGRERDFGGGRRIVNVVDLYVSPFGEYKVQLNRFLDQTKALLMDPQFHKIKPLRSWNRTMLAKSGDSEKHQLLGEYGFCHTNYKATGIIENLNGGS
jgi:hypothetical protein